MWAGSSPVNENKTCITLIWRETLQRTAPLTLKSLGSLGSLWCWQDVTFLWVTLEVEGLMLPDVLDHERGELRQDLVQEMWEMFRCLLRPWRVCWDQEQFVLNRVLVNMSPLHDVHCCREPCRKKTHKHLYISTVGIVLYICISPDLVKYQLTR